MLNGFVYTLNVHLATVYQIFSVCNDYINLLSCIIITEDIACSEGYVKFHPATVYQTLLSVMTISMCYLVLLQKTLCVQKAMLNSIQLLYIRHSVSVMSISMCYLILLQKTLCVQKAMLNDHPATVYQTSVSVMSISMCYLILLQKTLCVQKAMLNVHPATVYQTSVSVMDIRTALMAVMSWDVLQEVSSIIDFVCKT